MEEKTIILGVISLIVDILVNLYWPFAIITNTLLEAVFNVGIALNPNYWWMFTSISIILTVGEYIIIYIALSTFLKDPIISIKTVLNID